MGKEDQKAYQITLIGLVTNLLLAALKIFAGLFGQSEAIIADAFHSLSDLSTDIAVLIGFKGANKPIDKTHDYGHGKVETLVSAFIGIVLFVIGVRILGSGLSEIAAFLGGQPMLQPRWIACVAAVISVVTKEYLFRRTIKVGRDVQSQSLIANAWHHRSDALSSLGVMCGITGAIVLGEPWRILDPVAAVFVSILIIKTSFSVLKESVNELMEASLSDEMENEIMDTIKSTPGAKYPHNLKTRRIGRNIAIDIHIKVAKELNISDAHNIATAVENKLKKRFGDKTFIYVHVEPDH